MSNFVDEIEPVWVRDLLGLWAAKDVERERGNLSFASVSPMFARMGTVETDEDDHSYSRAELAALGSAVDRLLAEHPDEWAAVQRCFRPWTRGGIDGADDRAVLLTAAKRLAGWVDTAMGD